jgi:hypothetical protein
MANELINQSQSRDGAAVLWITIHTAEGATDEFPSRPDLDAGSADDLLRFFEGKRDRSCHAVCDDDKIIDNLVPYDRAAWTLRGGNNRSDNLEMCGIASWSRAEWLTHDGMLQNAAKWVARRLTARAMAPHRVTVTECANRSHRGYMDHWTYTRATGDGTHTDVGKFFPWDVFGNYVISSLAGVPLTPGGLSVADADDIIKKIDKNTVLIMRGDDPDPASGDTHPANLGNLLNILTDIQADVAEIKAQMGAPQ